MSRKNFWLIIKILILFKVAYYYSLINIENNVIPIYLITVGVIGVVFLLRNKFISTLIYTAITLVMFANATNFIHFNALLSVEKVANLKLLPAVMDSVVATVNPLHLLLFVDVLLMYAYTFTKKRRLVKRANKINPLKISVSTLMIIVIFLIAFNPVNSSIVMSINNQELFTYHIKDAIYEQYFETEADEYTEAEANRVAYRKIDNRGNNFGIGRDRNLIVIQLEAFQNFLINKTYNGQTLTPVLNDLLKKDTIYFSNYYQQIGSGNTADSEFVGQNSIYPVNDGYVYEKYDNNHFYGLPWLLREQGYTTAAFHGFDKGYWNRESAYNGQGFEVFYSGQDYSDSSKIGLGINDEDFYKETTEYLSKMPEPFYGFAVSLSGHHPYNIPQEFRSLELKKEDEGTLFGNYLLAASYADEALGVFIEELKAKKLYDNSVIVIYGDHFGLNANDESNRKHLGDFLEKEYNVEEMMNVPLIINIPGMNKSMEVETVGGQIDLLPTLLHIMGVNDRKILYFGQNLLNAKKGFVASRTYFVEGSYITDDIVFIMSRDGIYENSKAYNRKTGEPIDVSLLKSDYDRAIREIGLSDYVLKHDSLKHLILDNMKLIAYYEKKNKIEPPEFIAHGGGLVSGSRVTNSKEALDFNYYKGFRFFELDFVWTSDGIPVISHDWDAFFTKYFDTEAGALTHEEFMNLKMINNWQQLDLEGLAKWLRGHEDTYIISDAKENNIELLETIKEDYPDLQDRFIPQIYYMDEYIKAEYIGYENLIYTLYKSDNTEEEVEDFIMRNNVFAVTLPKERIGSYYKELFRSEEVFIYTHTVNDEELADEYRTKGINGFYTDSLNLILN